MQFLITLRRRSEIFDDAAFSEMAEAEVEQAKSFYQDGFIRQIWHRGDEPGACLIVEADSEGNVRTKLDDLPMVRMRMLEVVSLIPLLPYRGFAPRG